MVVTNHKSDALPKYADEPLPQMIKNIRIQNFKCFDVVDIRDVALVNVLVGDNGAGKTSLLEAAVGLSLMFATGFFVKLLDRPKSAP